MENRTAQREDVFTRPSFSLTLRLASTNAASAAACVAFSLSRSAAYSGSVSQ